MTAERHVIVSADDFGLSLGVNEAVEQACREGVLRTASLMVAGPAAADAVQRAQRLPHLHVGLHVVAVDGPGIECEFPRGQVPLAFRYAFQPSARPRLARDIRAQFAAFARTGLRLDHANAHKHMHMHPTVGRLIIEIGREFGLPALRIPFEPTEPLRQAGTEVGLGARALNGWSAGLRRRALRAGLRVNDQLFGIAWTGHMTADRVAGLIPHLPPGLSEIYFHPATRRDGELPALMPDYDHEAELAALLDPKVRAALEHANITLSSWSEPPPAARAAH